VIGPIVTYYRGSDGFGLDQAVIAIARHLEKETGAAPDRWRTTGNETSVDVVAERVGTAPMFGGGTVAVVVDPGPLVRSKDGREALERALRNVAPGNALVFIEQGEEKKRAAMLVGLEAAVVKAGGIARVYDAPKSHQLAGWLGNLARTRGLALERDAAQELARRVGGFVTEGDVDRQRQGAMAAAELDKLAIYRGTEPITVADVQALVPEVIPDSTWAMLDAVAERNTRVAGPALDRLLEVTPLPVVVVQLHRRLRELLLAADLIEAGASPAELVKAIGGHPFRVEQIAKKARLWTVDELASALEGVLDLDAALKRAGEVTVSESQGRLLFTLWIQNRVAPSGPRGGGSRGSGPAAGPGSPAERSAVSRRRTTPLPG
jgi:DNA polymerase III subunit delta